MQQVTTPSELGVPRATLVTNFETLGAVATKTWTVPTGKRWLFLDGSIERDGAATVQMNITDADDQIYKHSDTEAAGTTRVQLASLFSVMPIVMDAGHKAVLTYSVAQTTPEVTFVVLEIAV